MYCENSPGFYILETLCFILSLVPSKSCHFTIIKLYAYDFSLFDIVGTLLYFYRWETFCFLLVLVEIFLSFYYLQIVCPWVQVFDIVGTHCFFFVNFYLGPSGSCIWLVRWLVTRFECFVVDWHFVLAYPEILNTQSFTCKALCMSFP